MKPEEQINFILHNFDFKKALKLIRCENRHGAKLTLSDLKNEAKRCLTEAINIKDISDGIYGFQAECYIDSENKMFLELRYTPILSNTLSKILNQKKHVNTRQK